MDNRQIVPVKYDSQAWATNINEVLTRSAGLTKPTNDASKQLMNILSVYTQRMELGGVATQIAGAFKKSVLKTGKMDFSFMKDIVFQEDFPFNKLCTGAIKTKIEKETLYLQVEVGNSSVKKLSNIAAGYELEAILIFGDPSKERGLRIESERSRLYTFKEKGEV